MIQFLQSRRNLFSDGTFRKRCKKPTMAQIFNIVTKYGDNIVCLVRVLMMSRTTAAYRSVLQHLKVIAPNMNPECVHCDFELAQMNAWKLEFPRCRVAGCLWHYAVDFSSTARTLGLGPLAMEQPAVMSVIRGLCGVSMLPADLMWQGVEELWHEVERAGWNVEMRPLFEHFERYWLPRRHELTVYGLLDRTNNCAESDNRTLGNVLPQNRPNVWHLIGGFVQLEFLAWSDKLAIDDLRPVTGPRKWKTLQNDRTVALATRLMERNEISLRRFLHRVSYAVLAAVKHGLRLRRNQQDGNSSDEHDADSDDGESSEYESSEIDEPA